MTDPALEPDQLLPEVFFIDSTEFPKWPAEYQKIDSSSEKYDVLDPREEQLGDLELHLPEHLLVKSDIETSSDLGRNPPERTPKIAALDSRLLDEIQEHLSLGIFVHSGVQDSRRLRLLVEAPGWTHQELQQEAVRIREELELPSLNFVTDELQERNRNYYTLGTQVGFKPENVGVLVRAILPEALAVSRISVLSDKDGDPSSVDICYRRPGVSPEIEAIYAEEVETVTGLPAHFRLHPDEWVRDKIRELTPKAIRIDSIALSFEGKRADNRMVAHPTVHVSDSALPHLKPWIRELENLVGVRIEPIVKPVSDEYFEFVRQVGDVKTGALKRRDRLPELVGEFAVTTFEPVNVSHKPSRGRRIDLTGQKTYVVDPPGAHDRDDGFSILTVPGGLELQIHIADVPALVRLGSEQLTRGLKKAFTVYGKNSIDPLHDRRLALEVGSLKQDRVRFAWTVPFSLKNGEVSAGEPFRSLIRVTHAFDYEELYDSLLDKSHPLHDAMKRLADFHEYTANIFEEGASFEGRAAAGHYSHALIAKNNILFNRMLANYMASEHSEVPFMYRAFQPPSEADRSVAQSLLEEQGLGFITEAEGRERYQRALRFLKLTAGDQNFSPEIARVIGEAYYTLEPSRHAFFDGFYCHGSSPLRRGSDIAIGYQLAHVRAGTAPLSEEFMRTLANYFSRQSLLESQRHLELRTKEELSRHENLLGQTMQGALVHVGKSSAIVDVPGVGRGIIQREDGTVEMDRSSERVFDVRTRQSFRKGDVIAITYDSINLWRFKRLWTISGDSHVGDSVAG
ncbi:MAG: RNB domain-containing ribonuclease [Bdellovibrionales bacterium]|nr:RNB domain-containing ribonuclease [Bdellovibrionales bacterium]